MVMEGQSVHLTTPAGPGLYMTKKCHVQLLTAGFYYSLLFMLCRRIIPPKTSGLDKDLDQWVFHPLLFKSMSILLNI